MDPELNALSPDDDLQLVSSIRPPATAHAATFLANRLRCLGQCLLL